MTNYMRFICFILLLCSFSLIVTNVDAQKKRNVGRKQNDGSSPKITDPRLIAPAPRTFNHSYEITDKYDKFNDFTQVVLRLPFGKGGYYGHGYISFYFTYIGNKLMHPPKSILFWYYETKRTYLGNTSTMIAFADNDKLIKHSSSCNYSDGSKACLFEIPYKTFLLLTNSSKVEMQIGDKEFQLSQDELEAMKDFASRTNSNSKKVSS